jgi:hypothetical protein
MPIKMHLYLSLIYPTINLYITDSELKIMRNISHPHIIKMIDHYEHENYMKKNGMMVKRSGVVVEVHIYYVMSAKQIYIYVFIYTYIDIYIYTYIYIYIYLRTICAYQEHCTCLYCTYQALTIYIFLNRGQLARGGELFGYLEIGKNKIS